MLHQALSYEKDSHEAMLSQYSGSQQMVMDLNAQMISLQNQLQDSHARMKKTKLALDNRTRSLKELEEQRDALHREKGLAERKQESLEVELEYQREVADRNMAQATKARKQ